MPDLLVKLYDVADGNLRDEQLKAQGILIRRAIAPEMHLVTRWVQAHFGQGWASECAVCFSNHPVSCYIAAKDGQMLGFACYDATYKNFFGPTGVLESQRGNGIGTSLMLGCLNDMYAQGFGYCIIGDAGPISYYQRTVGASPIPDSSPGIYRGMLTSDR